jgi:hypothetical protein
MDFVYGHGPMPSNCVVGHCKDEATFLLTLKLWRAFNNLVIQRGRPLPPGKHILPTLVALWNRIKGGIDVYSRLMKNCKSVHHKLSPGAAIWLRVLMTMVYNGHQAYILLKSYEFLMDSTNCTLFKKYMQFKNSIGTFADYLRECINGITNVQVEGVARMAVRLDDDENNDDSSVKVVPATKRRRHNVRDSFFEDEEKVSLRKSRDIEHLPVRISEEQKTQHTCLWCCQRNHGPGHPTHTRFGYKTTMCCFGCGKIPLCVVKRYNGKSCFELWHSSNELFNPCANNVHSPEVC